jgi:hypothetical protein
MAIGADLAAIEWRRLGIHLTDREKRRDRFSGVLALPNSLG